MNSRCMDQGFIDGKQIAVDQDSKDKVEHSNLIPVRLTFYLMKTLERSSP